MDNVELHATETGRGAFGSEASLSVLRKADIVKQRSDRHLLKEDFHVIR